MSKYDLREEYVNRLAVTMGADLDFELLGMFHSSPDGYHWTKRGFPDKRYNNYPEVLAYSEAEAELRQQMINKAITKSIKEV